MGKLLIKINGVLVSPKKLIIKRPRWLDMIKNYPGGNISIEKIYETISKNLLKEFKSYSSNVDNPWENTCAFRMSRGLNLSGATLPKDDIKYRAKGAKSGVLIGDDNKNYWFRVSELKLWLNENLGSPEVDEIGGVGIVDKFKGKKGIIVFDVTGWRNATGHFTLWDGKDLSYFGMNEPERNDPNDKKNYYFNINYQDGINKDGTPHQIQTNRIRLWELK